MGQISWLPDRLSRCYWHHGGGAGLCGEILHRDSCDCCLLDLHYEHGSMPIPVEGLAGGIMLVLGLLLGRGEKQQRSG